MAQPVKNLERASRAQIGILRTLGFLVLLGFLDLILWTAWVVRWIMPWFRSKSFARNLFSVLDLLVVVLSMIICLLHNYTSHAWLLVMLP